MKSTQFTGPSKDSPKKDMKENHPKKENGDYKKHPEKERTTEKQGKESETKKFKSL